MNESIRHNTLKWKAVEWLYTFQNCKYIALELKVGKYIFDIVGSDGLRVYLMEAKQSKKDYQADDHNPLLIKEQIQNYRQLMKETGDKKKYIKLIKKEKRKSTKFNDDSLLRLSTFRYIIAPEDIVEKIPENWGIVDKNYKIIKKCEGNKIEPRIVGKIIADIAAKQTKQFLINNGVQFGKVIQFPEHSMEKI